MLGVAQLGSLKDTTITNYVRIVLARNLQLLSNILSIKKRSSWAFSVANDASTHYGKSYFDNRIRIHINGKLVNIHALAIPMFYEHTAENMFLLVSRFLDIIIPHWRMQLIGIGSDGANVMTGHFQGVVTQMISQTNHKVYRVWCGLHQLDLVLKRAYKNVWDKEVINIMKKFIAHLRQQYTLITTMKATCPQLTTRWLVMGKVSAWFLAKYIPLMEYLDTANLSQKPVEETPPSWWWIVIAGISALTDIINPVITQLQAPNLLVRTQATILVQLSVDICGLVGIEGPFTSEQIDQKALEGFQCVHGRWAIDYARIMEFLESTGMHFRHLLRSLSDELHQKVILAVGELAIGIVEGIVNIQAERDNNNNADEDVPVVLPHELVKISTSEYGNRVVDAHLAQLRYSWSEHDIAEIENQHRALCKAYRDESALRSALDACEKVDNLSFETAWAIVDGRFDILRDFSGGIATVFANTASVESDFSILGWEKDVFRLSITDLSLEGILQCKQYEMLSLLDDS